MASYSKYVELYNANMTGSMNGIVLFAYNESVNSANRTCTVTGRVVIRAYNANKSWTDNSSCISGYCVQHWFYDATNLTCNGTTRTTGSASSYNSNLGKSTYATTVAGIETKGGDYYNDSWGSNTWWGGFYALTDEFTWTLAYGDETSKSFSMSGTLGGRSGWSKWFHSPLSGTLTLPYLENHTKVEYTTNSGSGWSKDRYVYKTTDYGQTWTKIDIYKTSNSGSNWSKL